MKRYFYLIISVVVILAIALSYFIYKNKSDKDELVIEKDSGEKLKGASDLDERVVDKVTGSIKREEMVRYIESEIEITKKAIENYKDDPEKIKRYQNRLSLEV